MKTTVINFCWERIFYFTQLGNGYLEFEIKFRKADNTNFLVAEDIIAEMTITNEVIGLVNSAFVYRILYDS